LPKREDMRPEPKSPYAAGKLAGEGFSLAFNEVYGMRNVVLRYFNVYGPRQDPNTEYAAVIPKFVSAYLAGKAPVIFGDGVQTRDFVYVRDVVRANILASEAGVPGVYNIASGTRTSLNDKAIGYHQGDHRLGDGAGVFGATSRRYQGFSGGYKACRERRIFYEVHHGKGTSRSDSMVSAIGWE
jgi:UDP-glucose 4-epimerase